MKTIKYVMPCWVILLLSALFFACADDEDSRKAGGGDGKTLRISISAPEQKIISPLTKSNQSLAESVNDLWVLIYDSEGSLLGDKSRYVASNELTTTDLGKVIYQETIELPENPMGTIAVVANVGRGFSSKAQNYSQLQNYKFELTGNNPEFIMYYGNDFDLTKTPHVNAELVRIYSMITVVVSPDGLNQGVTVTPISLELKNIPDKGMLVPTSKIGENGITSIGNAEKIERMGTEPNFLSQGNAHALFLYENMKGEGANTGVHKDDQWYKTPPGMTVTKDKSTVFADPKSNSCSYIEIKALYKDDNKGHAGVITYRFFLGYDATNDFNVERNVHYTITMNLNGNGGEDEVSWRVDYDYLKNIKPQDIYMSYRAGSTARMYIEDVEEYLNTTDRKIKIDVSGPPSFTNWPNGVTSYFTVLHGGAIQYDEVKKKYYIEIQTNITNTHDYENKIGKATFTLSSDLIKDVTLTNTANITQVPRLVDPIAYYKGATNVSPKEVIVKEFDATSERGKYVNLRSVSKDNRLEDGSWSVEIAATSTTNNWFKIAMSEAGLSSSEAKGNLQDKITGTGVVKFWYKPNDASGNTPRFAKLIVRYHDEDCKHEIFLRQGYDPVEFGESHQWSSFNCLGTTSQFAGDNEFGETTSYPTQTGWLFNGGVDRAMHPFKPGYRLGYLGTKGFDEIKYSDGNMYDYGKEARKIYDQRKTGTEPWFHWQASQSGGTIYNINQRTESKKGPCPQGYIVADAWDYYDMLKNTETYTGYVHDDDPCTGSTGKFEGHGWTYGNLANGEDVELDDTNHCNPAKGAVFVDKESKCKNLFFNFGKGVLATKNRSDKKLLAEIGIGHRYGEEKYDGADYYPEPYKPLFAHLTYIPAGDVRLDNPGPANHAYGAYYWASTPFSSTGHLSKIDFGYDIFSAHPYLIDVPGHNVTGPGDPASGEARGINLYQHASFVRCVVKK